MRKSIGIVCLALGAVLILSALLFAGRNEQESEEAGRQSDELLAQIEAQIGSQPSAQAQPGQENEAEPTDPMALARGYEAIGILDLPDLELRLPVLADYDEARLQAAPCRHLGSLEDGNLVIAGHNYKRHFAYLKNLVPGARITFTDMEGTVHPFVLDHMATIAGTDVAAVTDSSFPLILYTCDYTGEGRITLFFSAEE